MARTKQERVTQKKLIAAELERTSGRIEMPEEVFNRYKSALDVGVIILANPDNAPYVNYRHVDRLAYLLDKMYMSDGSYWVAMCLFFRSPNTARLRRASILLTGLSESLRSRDLANIQSKAMELQNTGLLVNLQTAQTAFDSGCQYVNKQLSLERARIKVKDQLRRSQGKEAAVAQVVKAATRTHLTTPEYRIKKTTVRPLPGSYGFRQ